MKLPRAAVALLQRLLRTEMPLQELCCTTQMEGCSAREHSVLGFALRVTCCWGAHQAAEGSRL